MAGYNTLSTLLTEELDQLFEEGNVSVAQSGNVIAGEHHAAGCHGVGRVETEFVFRYGVLRGSP